MFHLPRQRRRPATEKKTANESIRHLTSIVLPYDGADQVRQTAPSDEPRVPVLRDVGDAVLDDVVDVSGGLPGGVDDVLADLLVFLPGPLD